MLNRPSQKSRDPGEAHRGRDDARRYRFEWTTGQLALRVGYGVALLCVMFVFGILAGRGLPPGTGEEATAPSAALQVLGLKPDQPWSPGAAETWGNREKMLASLEYNDALERKSIRPALEEAKPAEPEPPAAPEPAAREPKAKEAQPPEAAKSGQPPEEPAKPDAEAAPPHPDEYYTIMVASLKNVENARALLARLKKQGYGPRMESVTLDDGGRWYRVLVGSFSNREEAQQFAAEFNAKEKEKSLVLRSGQ